MGLNYEYIFNVLRITTFLPSLKQNFSNVGYKKLAIIATIIATILLNCFRRICSLGGVILFPRRGDMTNNFRVLIRPPCKSGVVYGQLCFVWSLCVCPLLREFCSEHDRKNYLLSTIITRTLYQY